MSNTTDASPAPYASIPSTDRATMARDLLFRKIAGKADLPVLGSSVSRVVQLTSSNDEAVRKLAYFVLADVGLTQKILRMSNAVVYRNMSGTPVTTVSKAIFLLGFDAVKTSALAMLLVDRIPGKRAQCLRAELAHALGASVFGRELARRSHFKDAEEAAVAALFKNIGRVLVAAHDHILYKEIFALVEDGMTPTQASMQVLGCSFDMLSKSVLQEWNIPDTIIQALAPVSQGTLKPGRNRQEWIQHVAAFSSAAANLLPTIQRPGKDAASRALLARFGVALNLDEEKLAELFAVVAREARALTANAHLPEPPALVHDAVEPVTEEEPESDEAAESVENADADSADAIDMAQEAIPSDLLLLADDSGILHTEVRHASGKPVNARQLLLAGVQDVTEMMASGRCKVNDLILLVLETLCRSMGFRFATVCLKDIRTNQYRARITIGEDNAVRQAGFVFSCAQTRDLFHLAMANDADLLISDAFAEKIRDLIPAWHRALLPDARSFIILPLIVQKKTVGVFYADRTLPAPEGVPPDETALIKTLKGQVLAALNSRQ